MKRILLLVLIGLIVFACTSKKGTNKHEIKDTIMYQTSNNDSIICTSPGGFPYNDRSNVFINVDQMPQFPGGELKLLEFISRNLHYPIIAKENGIQGRVVVRFVVTETGQIEKLEILRSLYPACDNEAMRIVKLLPKFIPGKQEGKNVSVWYILPVTFKLDNHVQKN